MNECEHRNLEEWEVLGIAKLGCQQEMNNGGAHLRLGAMHLKQISILLKFRSKDRKADKWELL